MDGITDVLGCYVKASQVFGQYRRSGESRYVYVWDHSCVESHRCAGVTSLKGSQVSVGSQVCMYNRYAVIRESPLSTTRIDF